VVVMAHMHYKATGKVHSFRGMLEDTGQRKIRIQGPVGDRAWRVTKFQTVSNQNTAGGVSGEHWVMIWREEQATVSSTTPNINFENDELLGVNWSPNNAERPFANAIIFDNALFSRNIYVTHMDIGGSESCNYYIELEEVKLTKAGMAQLAVAAARRTID